MKPAYNLLAIVILGLFLELIIAYKLKTDKKRLESFDKNYKKEFNRIKNQLEKIVSTTKNESQKIITKTLNQYNDVNLEVKSLTLQMNQKINDITDEIIDQQKNLLQKHAKYSSHELVNTTSKEIQDISTVIKEEITKTQEIISKELILQSQTAQKEIQEFKESQKGIIAKQSKQLVSKVAKKYLYKTITNDQKHEITLQIINELWQTEINTNNE